MTGQSVFLPESVREGLHTDSGRNTDSRRGQVLPQELAQGLNLALVQGQIAFGGIAVEGFAVGGWQVHRGEDASGIAIERLQPELFGTVVLAVEVDAVAGEAFGLAAQAIQLETL